MRSILCPIVLTLLIAACGKADLAGADAGALNLDATQSSADAFEGPLDASSVGCDAAMPPDAATPRDAEILPDAEARPDATTDAAMASLSETEPNDFADEAQYNLVALPFQMMGTIASGVHPDIDVLGAKLVAGDLWTWQLVGPSGKVAPDLYLFEKAQKAPYLLSFAAPGQIAEQEQFVLEDGLWHVVISDKRNPADSTTSCGTASCVGGPDYDWRLTVRATPRAPTPAIFPSTVSGRLRHARAIDLYGFHASASFKFDIDLKAQRKDPPSDLQSQLSLFDGTHRKWVITNDGVATSDDAHIGADLLPADADYVLVVENLRQDAIDLSYRLDFTVRP